MTKAKRKFFFQGGFAVLVLCVFAYGFVLSDVGVCDAIESSNSFCLTPPSGSSLRRAVLNALRREVKRIHGINMVFIVRHLKVKNGWAWAETLPQSPDGANHYEDVSALLNFRDGRWRVVEIPCLEEDNPDCLNDRKYLTGLKKRFPKIPVEILSVRSEKIVDKELNCK